MLEERGYPVGVVSAIQGQTGVGVAFTGEAGHAGTVPMTMRHDALTAAAEFALAVEALGQQTPGLVATVGRFQVAPGASNVIPGLAELSLDVRHPENSVRLEAVNQLARPGRSDRAAPWRPTRLARWRRAGERGLFTPAHRSLRSRSRGGWLS